MESDERGKVDFQEFLNWQQKHESTQEYKAAKLRRKKKLEMERRGAILTRGKSPKNQQQQSADEGSNAAGNTANANSLAAEWDVEISWRANKWIMDPAYSLFLGFLGLLTFLATRFDLVKVRRELRELRGRLLAAVMRARHVHLHTCTQPSVCCLGNVR